MNEQPPVRPARSRKRGLMGAVVGLVMIMSMIFGAGAASAAPTPQGPWIWPNSSVSQGVSQGPWIWPNSSVSQGVSQGPWIWPNSSVSQGPWIWPNSSVERTVAPQELQNWLKKDANLSARKPWIWPN